MPIVGTYPSFHLTSEDFAHLRIEKSLDLKNDKNEIICRLTLEKQND